MPASDVATVAVTCTDQAYTFGGTVSFNALAGVTLSDQGLVITNTSNGDSYAFGRSRSRVPWWCKAQRAASTACADGSRSFSCGDS
jgi:hypothetical protein